MSVCVCACACWCEPMSPDLGSERWGAGGASGAEQVGGGATLSYGQIRIGCSLADPTQFDWLLHQAIKAERGEGTGGSSLGAVARLQVSPIDVEIER